MKRGKPKQRKIAEPDIVVTLDVADHAAVQALADALLELASDLWLDGKLDLG